MFLVDASQLGPYKSAFNVIVPSDMYDLNMYNLLISTGWSGSGAVVAFITINSGTNVGSNSTSNAALTISGFAAGSSFTLTNNGNIIGRGGQGGDVVWLGVTQGRPGGPAISTSSPLTIINNGIIGGGGGGSGAEAHVGYYGGHVSCSGGGGAGWVPGARGDIYNGGEDYPGSAGSMFTPGRASTHSGNGPYGGYLGQAGQNYVGAFSDAGIQTSAGGAGGAAVVGNSYVTWSVTGDIRGSLT